jgi:hypothetical protein
MLPREGEISQEDITKLETTKEAYLKSEDGAKAGANDGFVKII